MKVSEMIAALSKMDPDLPLVVSGYEAGATMALPPVEAEFEDYEGGAGVLGEFCLHDTWHGAGQVGSFQAVYIGGKHHSLGLA